MVAVYAIKIRAPKAAGFCPLTEWITRWFPESEIPRSSPGQMKRTRKSLPIVAKRARGMAVCRMEKANYGQLSLAAVSSLAADQAQK